MNSGQIPSFLDLLHAVSQIANTAGFSREAVQRR